MAAMKKKQSTCKYGAPISTTDTLVNSINEVFGLGIVRSDLTSPEAEKIMNIYCCILEDLGNIAGVQQPIHQFALYQNPREVDEMESMTLYSNIYSVIRSLGIFEFDIMLTDFIKPAPKRVISILNQLMNFWNYCNHRAAETDLVMETCRGIAEKKNRLQIEAPLIERQINDAVSQIGEKRANYDMKTQEVAESDENLKTDFKKKLQVKDELKSLKPVLAETEREFSVLQTRVEELQLSIRDCNSRIIESPEKLNQMTEELEKELSRIKLELKNSSKKSEANRKAITNISNWIAEVTAIITSMKSISEQMSNKAAREDSMKKIEAEKLTLHEDISDSDAKLKTICEKESSLREQIHSIDHKNQLKLVSLQASLIEAQQSLEKIKLSNLERNKNSIAHLEMIEKLTSDISVLQMKWQAMEDKAEDAGILNKALEVMYLAASTKMKTLKQELADIAFL